VYFCLARPVRNTITSYFHSLLLAANPYGNRQSLENPMHTTADTIMMNVEQVTFPTYTKEEQKQHRQELIKALRSGEYTQCQAALKEIRLTPLTKEPKPSYCCLGVGCEISGLGKWDNENQLPYSQANTWTARFRPDYNTYGDFIDSILDETLSNYYGFATNEGGYFEVDNPYYVEGCDGDFDDPKTFKASLVDLNDVYKWTFNQIADIIEKEPKGMLLAVSEGA
jgi:hypothetical protein